MKTNTTNQTTVFIVCLLLILGSCVPLSNAHVVRASFVPVSTEQAARVLYDYDDQYPVFKPDHSGRKCTLPIVFGFSTHEQAVDASTTTPTSCITSEKYSYDERTAACRGETGDKQQNLRNSSNKPGPHNGFNRFMPFAWPSADPSSILTNKRYNNSTCVYDATIPSYLNNAEFVIDVYISSAIIVLFDTHKPHSNPENSEIHHLDSLPSHIYDELNKRVTDLSPPFAILTNDKPFLTPDHDGFVTYTATIYTDGQTLTNTILEINFPEHITIDPADISDSGTLTDTIVQWPLGTITGKITRTVKVSVPFVAFEDSIISLQTTLTSPDLITPVSSNAAYTAVLESGIAFYTTPYATITTAEEIDPVRIPLSSIPMSTPLEFDATLAYLSETSKNTRTFIGKESDSSTGLTYFGARYYDPLVGRFTATDPYLGSIYDPRSLIPYSYGFNNPMKYVDRYGKWAVTVHKRITNRAISKIGFQYRPDYSANKSTYKKLISGLRAGSVFPDIPEGFPTEDHIYNVTGYIQFGKVYASHEFGRVYDFLGLDKLNIRGVSGKEQFEKMWKQNISFRTHYSDLAFWHSMIYNENDADQVKFMLTNRVMGLIGISKTYLKTKRFKLAAQYLGQALHTIQDSYAPSHVRRDKNTMWIMRFQDYAEQDAKLHMTLGDFIEGNREFFNEATRATERVMRMVLFGGDNLDQIESFIKERIFIISGTTIVGGTEQKFRSKKERCEERNRLRELGYFLGSDDCEN